MKLQKNIAFAIVTLFAFSLSACAPTDFSRMSRGQLGAGEGAAAGAIIGQAIGHSTEATLIGVAIGTMLGYIVGNEMDKNDRMELNRVYERGQSGRPVAWTNPDKGNRYTATPQPAFTDRRTGRICRQAKINAWIDGKASVVHTTACRDPYGQWEIVARK